MWDWDEFQKRALEDEKENTKKVKASSRPPNSCYGVWDVKFDGKVFDPENKEPIKFKTYDDALTGLKELGYCFWNPELSHDLPQPTNAAYVCYVTLPKKLTETG